ncbi:hypothetical protein FNT36_18045 [Hymenobacter setariae]|uniref:STAS/SEC14 domain-containing protein n=1 Tax=Hymenobacter setariae TaxID=2594794 RepID=A0A558BSP3_9BACT|nr:hypothetical protein [Hymenobacter setariae]TVT39546.1 hypothetical protein FNT36_18045 [Hymenobacter setariae]
MRALTVVLPQTDYLVLRYRPDLHLLVGRWQRPVSAAEFRQGYRAMLRLARQVNCPYWQLDLRGRGALPDDDTRRWLLQRFLPELALRLPEPVCLAYLLPPSLLQQMAAPAGSAAHLAFFSEEGPLTAWLLQCQHRSSETLAQAGAMPPPAA